MFVESQLGKVDLVFYLEDDEENPHHGETEDIIILDDDGDKKSMQDGGNSGKAEASRDELLYEPQVLAESEEEI